jgi:hypothetical protein
MKKNNYIEPDESHDFGFSFAHEDDIMFSNPVNIELNEQVEDLKNRLHALEKMFLPLLENLSKDPDKPMIKWPNRKEVIEKQIRILKQLTNI